MKNVNNHIKSDKIKWIVVFSVITLIVAAIVLGVFSSWYTNWNVKTWFGRSDEQQEPVKKDDTVIIDDTTKGTIPLPQRMAFAPLSVEEDEDGEETYSAQSVTVTATVLPENATVKTIIWSVSWSTSNSANVNDYVTVESVDETTATVSCLQPFFDEIVLTATSNSNKDVSASCSVFYARRLKSFVAQIFESQELTWGEDTVTLENYVLPLGAENLHMATSAEYDIGSSLYQEQIESCTGTINLNSENQTVISNISQLSMNSQGRDWPIHKNTYQNPIDFGSSFCLRVFGTYGWSYKRTEILEFLTKLNNGDYGADKTVFTIELTVEGSYGTVITETFKCGVDISRLVTPVDSVGLDNNTITF